MGQALLEHAGHIASSLKSFGGILDVALLLLNPEGFQQLVGGHRRRTTGKQTLLGTNQGLSSVIQDFDTEPSCS